MVNNLGNPVSTVILWHSFISTVQAPIHYTFNILEEREESNLKNYTE